MGKIALRDYQESAFAEIRVLFRDPAQNPVLFVLPTGGGKTYTFSAIAASAAEKGREVIIIVHRKELLLQASASLENLGIDHGLISPDFTPNPHALVQVASVDTLLIRLKKRPYRPKPGGLLLIYDEAHHVVDGNKWGRVYEALGRPPVLGVTATPVRTDGKGLGAHAGGIFKSMVLGPSPPDLIARGMLVTPEVYGSPDAPDFDDLKTNREGDYNLADLAEKVDKPKITGDAVEHYSKICPGAKTIAFCASVEHARHVMEAFNAAGYRFALLVGAPAMSDAERTSVNKRLRRGELDGACTVDLVSEGYDLPDLECCIMLRHTASEGLFLQQAGRIMRPSPSKRGCWLLDHVANVGKIIDGEFKRKHGLPSEVREWTLDGRKKKKGRKLEEDMDPVVRLKQCPKCFACHVPMDACPGCGYVYPAPTRAPEQVEGQLVKIDEAMVAQERKQQLRVQASAKTVDEMMERLGYSQTRAEAIVRARAEKEQLWKSLQSDAVAWARQAGIQPRDVLGVYASDLSRLKPKELKAKREVLTRAQRMWAEAAARGDDPTLALQLAKILNPANAPLI